MQTVPTISQDLWDALGENVQRPDVLIEFYPHDTLPGDDGFDPGDAVKRISGRTLTFLGHDYERYLAKNPSKINKTITEKLNSVSFELTNPEEPPGSFNRPMAAFVLGNTIEGMLVVIRVVSRSFTPTTLADSFVAFTGKMEKPVDVETQNQTISLSAKQYFGSVDEESPWRQFDTEDERGVEASDPLFEGFLFSAKARTLFYTSRVPRGGFFGLFGAKKTVLNTLQASTHGADAEKYVPLILGRAQAFFIPVAYIDAGTQINAIYNISEGPIKAIFDQHIVTSGFEFASEHDNNPEIDQFRFGYEGGTNGQVPFLDNLSGGIPANGYYSHSAMMSTAIYGTEISSDDPAPEIVAVILGMIIPIPNSSGEFSLEDWSDNPAFQTRWFLTHDRVFNLNEAFINDPQCIKTACYCDDPVLDETNGELIALPNELESSYGTEFRRYHSTGLFTPEYFKHYFLNQGQDPLPELTLPTEESGLVHFYDPSAGNPELEILSLVRRRFVSNIYLAERMKSLDFLNKVLLETYGGFLSFNARGKLDIKCRRPGDNTIIRSAATAGQTEIAVNSILAWIASLDGEVIVGNDLLTSEVKRVTGTRYSAVANSITLAVTGNLTASGATLTGGDDDNPATGSVTVTGLGTLTVTIEGHAVSYETVAADTTETAAAMLTQFLKADLTFQSFLKFIWDKDDPTVISIQSKLGFLELESALAEDHDVLEEVLRIQMSFSDRLFVPADAAKSNILRGTFTWPLGGNQSSVNRIDGTFIDSPQDFAPQPLRTRDQAHIDQVGGSPRKEDITLTGVDSFHQAKRLEMAKLAELRDLDFFNQLSSDGRSLLLEEGDLFCSTHASGGFRNVAMRVEEVVINLDRFTVTLVARRYSTSAYTAEAPQRNVPLPTTLLSDIQFNRTGPPNISFNTADYPPNGLIQTTESEGITSVRGGAIFGASMMAQKGKVYLKRPGETGFTQITTIEPDENLKAVFEFVASEEGTYTVRLETCFVGGACNSVKPEAQITVAFGVLGAMLAENADKLTTEAGDILLLEI